MNPFSLRAVFWREFNIFLLASSMMTVGTFAMAASLVEKTNVQLWWALVLLFPTLSALGGYGAYREARNERARRQAP